MQIAAKRRLIKNKTPVKTIKGFRACDSFFMSFDGHTLGGAGVFNFGVAL